MTWYQGFFEDSRNIIMKAFDFTLEQIEKNFQKKKTLIDEIHHDALDKEKEIIISNIKLWRKFINKVGDGVYSANQEEHAELTSIVRSALEVYLLSLQNALKQTNSPYLGIDISKVSQVMSLEGIRTAKSDLFLEYSLVKTSSESQAVSVFICYKDSPDKHIAGKVKELFEKARMSAFVAHDDIRLGKEGAYRSEILCE